MKKLLLLAIASTFSIGAWADDCDNTPAHSANACYEKEITTLKKQLNQVYASLYKQTNAKKELEDAQKSWLTYKEKQCGDFTLAEAGASSGQVIFDLSCQSNLLKSRINYLKSIIRN